MRRSGGGGGGSGRWPRSKGSSNSGSSNNGGNSRSNNSGGNSNRGRSSGGGNRGQICFDFLNTGTCRFGGGCKFLHSSAGQSQNAGSRSSRGNFQGSGKKGSGTGRNTNDSTRLIKQLKNTQPNQQAETIIRAGPLWSQCWGDAASSLAAGTVELLVQAFANVPFSSEMKVSPPPIHALASAMKRYLTTKSVDPLLAAETALNVVRKASGFEWEDKNQVVKALAQILEDAAAILQRERRNKDHRDCISRIDEWLDKLEKPWAIKEKRSLSTEGHGMMVPGASGEIDLEGNVPHNHYSNWRNATVGWLMHAPTFSPSQLPKMQGPQTKSQGVYKNREHYFDTMQRLMIGMAFAEGHSAVSPKCWENRGKGGQSCGESLVRVPDDYEEEYEAGKKDKKGGGPLRCRGRGCPNPPVLICKVSSHCRGLCQRRKNQLDENGKPRPIHWRSTKRLAVPNLVGIVRLGDASSVPMESKGKPNFYRSLQPHDQIHWAEICPHGSQTYEDKQRQQGNVCVNLASPSIFEPDNALDVEHEFNEGDVVAVVDCMSFTPEYMPVLRAYEQQQHELLPFDDGLLLNLDQSRPADLTNTVLGPNAQNKAVAEGDYQNTILGRFGCNTLITSNGSLSDGEGSDSDEEGSSDKLVQRNNAASTVTALPKHLIQKLVADMVASSTILPLREIRQNTSLSRQMEEELVDLLLKATLDFGQLVNFIDSLRNPLHVTQGPPGTGKSYLGVQIVHALAIVRKYWISQNPSVGTPPILVLSYKNHATDEMLADISRTMPSLSGNNQRYNQYSGNYSSGVQMIRMGNPSDPALNKFSEKNLAKQRGDPDVRARQNEVHELQDLRRSCQRAQRSATLFQSYQSDMFDTPFGVAGVDALSPDEVRKRQNNAAYEATEVLFAAIVRSHLLQTSNSSQKLQSIGSVLNKDAPDDPKFKLLQQHGINYSTEIRETLMTLYEGMMHYIEFDPIYGDPYELLFLFLSGQHPKPSCAYEEVDNSRQKIVCDQIAEWHDVPLCRAHRCVLAVGPGARCSNEIHLSSKGMLCAEHMCWSEGCSQPRIRIGEEIDDNSGGRIPVVERYCLDHSCFQCVKLNISPANEALDDPPRNACEEHPLCSVMDCLELAAKGEDYCERHNWKQCEYRNSRGQQCHHWAISSDMPRCTIHVNDWLEHKTLVITKAAGTNQDSTVNSNFTAAVQLNTENRKCNGLNRKKKPCKAFALIGSDFCEAHAPKDASFKAKQAEREAEFLKLQEDLAVQKEAAELQPKQSKGPPKEEGNQDCLIETVGSILGSISDSSPGEIYDDCSDYGPPPDLDNVDLACVDNLDELDEGDGVQHIRDVFEIESGDEEDEESDDDDFQDALDHLHGVDTPTKAHSEPIKDPKEWSWSLALDDRWAACQAFMHTQCEDLQHIQILVKSELPLARKRLREAESRSRARVFESKTVIGGTIVGCIARLEAIRATRPFAIIVEEASEVLEPLLFACLCQSTVKLQLIGDHLQLQPSLMDKFDFVRTNRVNLSLFQRLICAPEDHRVPSGVLSVQRRMRRDVCDLTREYYSDIVAIEDHPLCATKTLPGQDACSSFWMGREVPGIRSHLYLWTHSGAQGRADVGVSKQNKQEAQMCVNLAYYLVKCGSMKSSIAILTPYKGQLMLIRKLLLSDQSNSKLLTRDPSSQNQVRLSTVDRFQGDESDIVIASLVVDEKSRTQFVKLQNRMIVLLSRARLGCYIVGNLGYFKNTTGGAKHWMRTFSILEKPPETSDNSEGALISVNAGAIPGNNDADTEIAMTDAKFTEARVGSALPLCCPQHPLISCFEAKTAKELDLGFCQVICEEELACSHTCGLKCHWPKKAHNKKCKKSVDSPCSKHPEQLICMEVYKNTTTPLSQIDDALIHYQCPKKVQVTLPCSHDESMACWEEDMIAQGKTSFPKCQRKSPRPFVYSDCGHTLEVTCHKLEQYSTNSSRVKPCAEMVEYRPVNCTHAKQIKCYLDKEYQSGNTKFVCPEKLTVVLPRCGHEMNNIACSENVNLEAWTGCKVDEVGVVQEGVQYGEKDYQCTKMSKFVRKCGHEETMTCMKAFEMAKAVISPCLVRVPSINPHCGHPCNVACTDAKKLNEVEKLTAVPINEVYQASSPKFPDNLPRGVGKCTELVTLHRSCGHSHQVACGAARSTQTRCREEVTIRSTLCGHELKVACWRSEQAKSWQPWNKIVFESLLTNATLPADAKPNEGVAWPDTDVLSMLKGCSGNITVSKSCGHTYKEKCGDLVSILQNAGKSKKGSSCTESVSRELPTCGHEVTVLCKTWQSFVEKRSVIKCNASVEKSCWNSGVCGNILSVSCADACDDTASICCPQRLKWTCESGRHSHMLQLCMSGIPQNCPECVSEDITDFIGAIKTEAKDISLPHIEISPELVKVLGHTTQGWHRQALVEEYLQNMESKVVLDTEAQTSRFLSALAQTLGKYQRFSSQFDPFKRPILSPILIPIFFILGGNKKKRDLQKAGFIRMTHFIKSDTLGGIGVFHMTRDNILSLANESKGSMVKTLLCGYLVALRPKVGCDWPTGKKSSKQDSLRQWREVEGHDCIEFNPKKSKSLMKPLIVWDPAALYATHCVGPFDADQLRQFGEDIGAVSPTTSITQLLNGQLRTVNGKTKIVGEITATVDRAEEQCDPIEAANQVKNDVPASMIVSSLQGTWAESIEFARYTTTPTADELPLQLHQYTSQTGQGVIPVSAERDLMTKLSLVSPYNDNPFGGKKALDRRMCVAKGDQQSVSLYQLLLALEIAELSDQDLAMKELVDYCHVLQKASRSSTGKAIAHPLLLLAFARIGFPSDLVPGSNLISSPQKAKMLRDFSHCAPSMLKVLLNDEEMRAAGQLDGDPSASEVDGGMSKAVSPADLWAELKDTHGFKSDAMEDLLKMTGLRRVKQTAVELFKQGLVLSHMDAKTRKLNSPSLNYVFLGNPGTGKTTVARIFAQILSDSGLRQNNNFVETSGQDLKEAGVDEFKKKAKSAIDGVLFMDEAYTLDPCGDKFKGAPVANEMLTLAENSRDRLSFILAGYEDEINNNLFAFNPGFRSRFKEVQFEDFEFDELLTVWNGLREERCWREADNRIGLVVTRRLMKSNGRKGFGNARAVRQKLEEACARAIAREDFEGQDLELRMEDAVGQNPIHNDKLQAVLAQFDTKTGWLQVKQQVKALVSVCTQNYERELQGQEQLPVLLNRLFLGNPGTGKTTCAKLYGKLLKELGFLTNGEVVDKTAGDLGGSVVGESKQKTVALIEQCRGKVLLIDEAYGLNDNLYGKQALDALVEKVQGTENDDIAVLLLGYKSEMMDMLDNQNPGLRRRFAADQAFQFEDYSNAQLEKILLEYCRAKQYKPSLEFRERALKKLDMQRRSESHFGNAGSVQNLLKDALARATSKRTCNPDGSLHLEPDDIELPGDGHEDSNVFADLQNLYRMEVVVSELKKLKSQFDLAEEEGEERPQLGHFVFTGAPGTGKTTVARSLGKMLNQCGLLARPDVLETSGLKLTGEFAGSTKKIVEEQLDKAKGGVLFIDEAYELGNGAFGSEACSVLVEAMTNDEKYGGLVIVVAGYQSDMMKMLDTNQGLKSRFKRFIDFPDWHPSDCTHFFSTKSKAHNFSIENEEESMGIVEKGFKKLKPLNGWGNARDVNKFYESLTEERAQRLSTERAAGGVASFDRIFMKEDIAAAMDAMVCARMGSGGAPKKSEDNADPFEQLNKLYRMETVKKKLQQLQNTYIVASRDGEDPPPLGHFTFVGSPGTGKTTVARVMSEILYDLGLTSRRHVEETSGLKLQGKYMGETKTIVEENLKKAMGGVLFIDEAYTLGQGCYGSEACDTLVAAMTDPQYAGVIVIIAGYPQDISEMLDTNAGLRSRFTHTLEFPDWGVVDCVKCFTERAMLKGFELQDKGVEVLQNGFEILHTLDGFGNARDVDAVWKATNRFRADRIVAANTGGKTFEEVDLKQAVDELVKGRSIAEGKESLTKKFTFDEALRRPPLEREDPNYKVKDAPTKVQTQKEAQVAFAEEVHQKEEVCQEMLSVDEGRDPGVSDEVWAGLQMAKQAEEQYMEKCLAEEAERKRIEAEIEAQLRAKQLAKEAYEKKMRELERQRQLVEERKRQKEKIVQKLRAIGNCPAGFQWHKCGSGWRCGGGTHYVSDEQLNKSFGYDV